jgi:hypothetical protein
MNPRFPIAVLSAVACALLVGAGLKQRELGQLRAQNRQIADELAQRDGATSSVGMEAEPAPDTSVPAELLRLRNEVGQLMERKKSLGDLRNENQRLTAAITARSTNDANTLPPGYMRKSQAQWAGMSTPENTLQSLLWTLQNRDQTNLLRLLTTESASRVSSDLASDPGKFFDAAPIPGLRVLEQKTQPDGSIIMQVEFIPGQGPLPGSTIHFRLIGGEWKMDLF